MVSIVGSTFIVKHVYNDNRTRFGRNAKLNRSELEVRLKVFFWGGVNHSYRLFNSELAS